MTTPQQPELRRKGHSPADPKARKRFEDATLPPAQEQSGPIPEENQPGHHPEHEQDQPDLDDVAGKLGINMADDARRPPS